MNLTDKIKKFLKSGKTEEKPPEPKPPVRTETIPQPDKKEIEMPDKSGLPEQFLAESAEDEKEKTIRIPYQLDENEIYHPAEETAESVVIPEGVKLIPKSAFKGKPVKRIQFPESLLWIGKEAFSGTALEEVLLPPSVQFLQEKTFADCKQLRNVILPAELLGIGENVFKNCPLLTSADIPESVCYLDKSYFSSPDINGDLKKSFSSAVLRLGTAYQQTSCSVPKSVKNKLDINGYHFQYSQETKLGKQFPERMKGHYFLNLSDSITLYRTVKGRRIVSVLERLPIFDSEDARYGSHEELYLFRSPDENTFSGIKIYGGYDISSVTLYENIVPADSKIKYLLDVLEL